jgi:hypothetical protein
VKPSSDGAAVAATIHGELAESDTTITAETVEHAEQLVFLQVPRALR